MLNSVPSTRFLLSLRIHWFRMETWKREGPLISSELPAKCLLLIPSAGLEEGVPSELEVKTFPSPLQVPDALQSTGWKEGIVQTGGVTDPDQREIGLFLRRGGKGECIKRKRRALRLTSMGSYNNSTQAGTNQSTLSTQTFQECMGLSSR